MTYRYSDENYQNNDKLVCKVKFTIHRMYFHVCIEMLAAYVKMTCQKPRNELDLTHPIYNPFFNSFNLNQLGMAI